MCRSGPWDSSPAHVLSPKNSACRDPHSFPSVPSLSTVTQILFFSGLLECCSMGQPVPACEWRAPPSSLASTSQGQLRPNKRGHAPQTAATSRIQSIPMPSALGALTLSLSKQNKRRRGIDSRASFRLAPAGIGPTGLRNSTSGRDNGRPCHPVAAASALPWGGRPSLTPVT